MVKFKFVVGILVLIVFSVTPLKGDSINLGSVLDSLIIEHEIAPLYIFQNDGNYGPKGTDYKAEHVGQQKNLLLSRRSTVEMRWKDKHRIIFLYAPFDVTTTSRLNKDIQFKETLFQKDTLIRHRYLFDGYRLSYLYEILNSSKVDLELGCSFQIRNAEVSFKKVHGGGYETVNDIGLVFALKSRLNYYPLGTGLRFMLESDGFSTLGLLGDSVRGAIYDVKIGVGIPFANSAQLTLKTGLLGGGAKVEDKNIDNWGNFGSASIGMKVDLVSLLGN